MAGKGILAYAGTLRLSGGQITDSVFIWGRKQVNKKWYNKITTV